MNRSLFSASNAEDHDFGYFCCEPSVITIDGLHINDGAFNDKPIYLAPKFTNAPADAEKVAPYGTVKEIRIKGLTTQRGLKAELCENPELYPDTNVIYCD